MILNMERYDTAKDVLDEVWNDSGKQNFSDSDSNFSNFEENPGANKDDVSIDSPDLEGVGTGLLNRVGSKGVKLYLSRIHSSS